MNSYQLISKLRKVRADTYLTAIDQALYHELISICNEKGWKDVFEARSSTLCASLNIWDKTLRKSRKILADAGLISFESCRDKRVGCYYSFLTILDNDMKSSVISSVNGTDDTQISPIIDINKTINEESLARTHESPPSPKKKSRKEKGDEKPLVYPFTSTAFMSAWEMLRKTPKWEKKLNYALQLSLDKLSDFEEEFAIQQIERAIESGWTGVVFTGTKRDYQEWLNQKYGNNQKSGNSKQEANVYAMQQYIAERERRAQGLDDEVERPF